MPNAHEKPSWPPEPDIVTVDTDSHEVARGDGTVIGRTRTSPTRHDGTQKRRTK